jgi:hypothetical protein
MSTDLTLDTVNNSNLKTVAEMPAWSIAQKQASDISHAARSDKYSELAYQNAISLQNLQNQSALDHTNGVRAISQMYLGALAEKFITLDPGESVSAGQLFKDNANASILSILSQLGGGQIGAKVAQSTPPTSAADTGFSSLLAMQNTLNQQNYSNNTTNSSLAATMTALAGMLTKQLANTPPKSV